MKTKLHQQFCKIHIYDYLFNNIRYSPLKDTIVMKDGKYDYWFLAFNFRSNQFENFYDGNDFYKIGTEMPLENLNYLKYGWEEIKGDEDFNT